MSNDDFLIQKEAKERGLIPEFKKDNPTHIIYKEARYHNLLSNMLRKDDEIKIVGIVRNPKGVINSWHHAPKEFDKENYYVNQEESFTYEKLIYKFI